MTSASGAIAVEAAIRAGTVSLTAGGGNLSIGSGASVTGTASSGDVVELVDGTTTYRAVKDKGGDLTSIVAHH